MESSFSQVMPNPTTARFHFQLSHYRRRSRRPLFDSVSLTHIPSIPKRMLQATLHFEPPTLQIARRVAMGRKAFPSWLDNFRTTK